MFSMNFYKLIIKVLSFIKFSLLSYYNFENENW